MRNFLRPALLPACALSIAGLTSGAMAGTVSYTGNVTTDASSLALSLFDSSLGTLERVTLSGDLSGLAVISASVSCTFLSCSTPMTGTLEVRSDFTRGSLFLSLFDSSTLGARLTCSASSFDSETCEFPLPAQDRDTRSATDAYTLGLFTGSGNFAIGYGYSFSTSNTLKALALGGSFTVTYDYRDNVSAVPEPGSLALAAAALALLARPRRPGARG